MKWINALAMNISVNKMLQAIKELELGTLISFSAPITVTLPKYPGVLSSGCHSRG